jgi:hypothetical protein
VRERARTENADHEKSDDIIPNSNSLRCFLIKEGIVFIQNQMVGVLVYYYALIWWYNNIKATVCVLLFD